MSYKIENQTDSKVLEEVASCRERLTRITDATAVRIVKKSLADAIVEAEKRGLNHADAKLPTPEPKEWKTYEQWQAAGRQVMRGQKSTKIDGIPVFEKNQTELKKSRSQLARAHDALYNEGGEGYNPYRHQADIDDRTPYHKGDL